MVAPHRRGRRARAVTLGVLGALVCGELGLRGLGYTPHFVNPIASFHVPDAEIGLRGRPGFAGRFAQPEFDVLVELDEAGFRVVEDSEPTGAGEPRLFVLGDSFTWGWGVDQGDGFVDRLADSFPDVEVGNLGLSGTGTVVAHRLFERHALAALRAGDVVLLVTFDNDLADNLGRNHDRWIHATVSDGRVTVVPAPPQGSSGRTKDWFKQHSCLFNLAAFVADRFKLARRQAQKATDSPQPRRTGAEPLDADEELVFRHYLTLLRDSATGRGATFAVACIPPRDLYEGAGPDDEGLRHRHGLVQSVPRGLGIPTLDLLPALSEPWDREDQPRTFAFDEHWTAAGHRIAATAMEDFLRPLLSPPQDAVKRR